MKKLFALLVMFVVASVMSVYALDIVKANGKYVTKKVVGVSGFTELTVNGSVDVVYKESKTTKVQIVGSENVVKYVDVKQSGNTLIVSQKNNASINLVGTKLRVEVYAPNVKKFLSAGSSDIAIYSNIVRDEIVCGIKGSGDISAYGLKADKIVVGIEGSGDFKARRLDATNIDLGVVGSGDIELKTVKAGKISAAVEGSGDVKISNGAAQEANLSAKGSGDIKAVNLRAVKTTAVALGSSEVKCCATKELVAVASGAGEVTYYGNPAKVSTKGSVNHRGN